MSFAEILEEIPKLSFAERQELIRQVAAFDDSELTPGESALLDGRAEYFKQNPLPVISLEQLEKEIVDRLAAE